MSLFLQYLRCFVLFFSNMINTNQSNGLSGLCILLWEDLFMYERNRFDPFSLIIGILIVIVGILALRNPFASFGTIVVLMAIAAIIEGIFKLFEIRNVARSLQMSSGWWTFSGIIDILFGILLFFVPSIGGVVVWISIAIWFIVDSLFELWLSRFLRNNNKTYYWFTVIISILGVVLGVILLFKPAYAISIAIFLLAFYLLLFGINQIIRSF